MDIEIFRLTRADIPGAVECIQKAFADDPAFKWLFNDPSKVCGLLLPTCPTKNETV